MAAVALAVLAAALWGSGRFSEPAAALDPGIAPPAGDEPRAQALVVVDSRSDAADDFGRLVGPYLDHFGVPFSVADLARGHLPANLPAYALIVIGHRGLAAAGGFDGSDQAALSAAVERGTGLVNFDNDLWSDGRLRYAVVQRTLAPTPQPEPPERDVVFVPPDAARIIDLSRDDVQDPVLATTSDTAASAPDDGRWTELSAPGWGTTTIVAAPDEFERHGLPPMRFRAAGVPAGDYDVMATLYTGPPLWDARYYFGFGGEPPRTRHVDAVGGSGGTREHTEYALGRVTIADGAFALTVQDADVLRGTSALFGWSRIRLVRATGAPHYITARHVPSDLVPTAPMAMAGMALGDAGMALAYVGRQPLLAVGTLGAGRVAQWGSYEWMRPEVRGPVGGLDDLVWRSLVWAARKPFAMQVLPNLLTMRVDDESGPLEWLHTAVDVGFKPWVGVFLSNLDDRESRELSALVRGGSATVSVHSFNDATFFYFDHTRRREWPAATMAAHWRQALEWHRNYDLPISTYVVPHFYEIGANALPALMAAGVEFLGIHMAPGETYGRPWLRERPFRVGVAGLSSLPMSVYYADDLVAASPGSGGHGLFNCVTEIRDDAGYEWYPSAEPGVTIGRGVRQLERALDSRTLATLFTHGYFFPAIPGPSWRRILEDIVAGVAGDAPVQMTIDAACALVRGQHTSSIAAAEYGAEPGQLRVTLSGRAEVATSVGVFDEDDTGIVERTAWAAPFTTSVQIVTEALPNRRRDSSR